MRKEGTIRNWFTCLRSKIKRCLPFDLVTTFKGDTHLGWVCHFIIAFARRRSKMEDATKSLQTSASLLFCWKKGGAGLGRKDQNKRKPCCTHWSTHSSEQFSNHQERFRFSPPEDMQVASQPIHCGCFGSSPESPHVWFDFAVFVAYARAILEDGVSSTGKK